MVPSKFSFFFNLVEKNSFLVKKILSVSKMASTVQVTENCLADHLSRAQGKHHVRTWNVRTMYKTGKAAQIEMEMLAYRLTLLGLCETIWKRGRLKNSWRRVRDERSKPQMATV